MSTAAATPTTASAQMTHAPHAITFTVLIGFRVRPWAEVRGGWPRATPAGMSAVTAARSPWVRDASAWPTRASNSSLVSRPCTNAALSTSITCSRSARDARR